MAEVMTRSDSPVTKILHSIDKLQEKYETQLSELGVAMKTFEKAAEMQRARLEELERRHSQGLAPGHYTSASMPTEDSRLQRKQVVGKWLTDVYRLVVDKPWAEAGEGAQFRANQVEDTSADGGYLVPTPLMPEVIRIVQSYGVARQICRVVPMQSKTLDLTSKLAGPSVSWPGEAVAPSATKATFARSTLTARKLIATDEISIEVDQDAAIDLGMYLLDLFGEALAQEEDTQAFVSNANPFTGVAYTSSVGSVTMSSSLTSMANVTYDNIVDLTNKPSAHALKNCRFVLSAYALNALRKIKDDNNNPIWAPMAYGNPGTILGYPYSVSEVMPGASGDTASARFVLFGDFKYSFIGIRGPLNVAFSDHAGFAEATRWMRVMERIAFVTPVASAFGYLKTAAS